MLKSDQKINFYRNRSRNHIIWINWAQIGLIGRKLAYEPIKMNKIYPTPFSTNQDDKENPILNWV